MSGVWRERLRFFQLSRVSPGLSAPARHYPDLRLARFPDEGRRFVSFGPVT